MEATWGEYMAVAGVGGAKASTLLRMAFAGTKVFFPSWVVRYLSGHPPRTQTVSSGTGRKKKRQMPMWWLTASIPFVLALNPGDARKNNKNT